MEEHEIIVYDEKGNELERVMESTSVTHMVRWTHTFENYSPTYSFNTHFTSGLVHWGMVPFPTPIFSHTFLYKES